MIVVCKKYSIETLIKELGINTTSISPTSTYIPLTDSFDEIIKSHCKASPGGENSSFIFTACVKSVPVYHFKLPCVVLRTAVKKVLKTHF